MLTSYAPGAVMPSLAATRVGHVRAAVDRGAGGHDDQVDVGGGQAGVGQRLAGRGGGHVGDRLAVGDPAGGDADPVADPRVVGVDDLGEVVVGEDPRRLVVPHREDARLPVMSLASDAGERLARRDRVVVVGEPLGEQPARARSPRPALPGATCPITCRSRSAPSATLGRAEVPRTGDHHPELRSARGRRPPCRAIRSRAAGRSSGVFRVTISGALALELPLDQAGEGAGRAAAR